MNKNITKFIERSIELGFIGMHKNDGGPFGAVVVKNGRIISEGWNEVIRTNDPTRHAEMVAISKASQKLKRFDLHDCEIYASGQPCPMCMSAIAWARIKKVYYANDYAATAKIGFSDKDIHDEIVGNTSNIQLIKIPSKKAADLYKTWSKKADKTMY